jgi:hypothetical protein
MGDEKSKNSLPRNIEPGPPRVRVVVDVAGAVFSRTGDFLLLTYQHKPAFHKNGYGNRAVLWEVATGKKVWDTEVPNRSRPLGFLSGDKTILLHYPDALEFRKVENGQLIRAVQNKEVEWLRTIVMSDDGKRLFVTNGRGGLGVWDLANDDIRTFGPVYPGRASLVVLHNGTTGLSVSSDPLDFNTSIVEAWDLATGKLLHAFKLADFWGGPTAVSLDGKFAAANLNLKPKRTDDYQVDERCKLAVWNMETQKVLRVFPGYANGLGFCGDGKRLVAANHERLTLWEIGTGREIWSKKDGAASPSGFALSTDGRWAFTSHKTYSRGGGNRSIDLNLWDLKKCELHRSLVDPPYATGEADKD